jgi:hypothetical protein
MTPLGRNVAAGCARRHILELKRKVVESDANLLVSIQQKVAPRRYRKTPDSLHERHARCFAVDVDMARKSK